MEKKYLVGHRVSFKSYVRHSVKELLLNFLNFKVSPIQSEVEFCFVVGCGHTGTTLLTSLIANSERCMAIGRETSRFLPSISLSASRAVADEWVYFCRFLKKSIVVEKTPKHVHCVSRIRRILPESKILVITRNPLDTCASLYERFGDIDYCISRWNLDSRASLEVIRGFPNVAHIKYEDLISDPESVMKRVFSFLALEWDGSILNKKASVYGAVEQAGNMALRAEQVTKDIYIKKSRWEKVFSKGQVKKVARETHDVSVALGYEVEPGA